MALATLVQTSPRLVLVLLRSCRLCDERTAETQILVPPPRQLVQLLYRHALRPCGEALVHKQPEIDAIVVSARRGLALAPGLRAQLVRGRKRHLPVVDVRQEVLQPLCAHERDINCVVRFCNDVPAHGVVLGGGLCACCGAGDYLEEAALGCWRQGSGAWVHWGKCMLNAGAASVRAR